MALGIFHNVLNSTTSARTNAAAIKPHLNKLYTCLPRRQQSFCLPIPGIRSVYSFAQGKWRRSIPEKPVGRWSKIKLLTWNINCMTPDGPARMAMALEHLNALYLDRTFIKVPLIICFQEMTSTFLDIIQKTPWIQSHFQLTNTDPSCWSSNFGTVTLIDRRLEVASDFRVPLKSNYGRDALFVDIKCENSSMAQSAIVRVCNTHLESFNHGSRLRPIQLALISQYLHVESVYAGIVAGDFNAINKNHDSKLHLENGLKDAYLEYGGKGKGFTWGMHLCNSQQRRYECNRLDKILHTSNIHVGKPKTFGRGLTIGDPMERRFVSDHLGVAATLRLKL